MTPITEQGEAFERFSLLGGPLHRLGRRLGLVQGSTNTVALGLALGGLLWAVLVALTLLDGAESQVFSLSSIGVHVRLLLVIPLLFLCESRLDPRLTQFVRTIVRSGIVPPKALPALESEITRTHRLRDSWLAEAVFLSVALLALLTGAQVLTTGTTATYHPSRIDSGITAVSLWYWIVCLTVFRLLMIRWLWRLGLWSYFLWRVARLDLELRPTHPDGAAGLGYLELVHLHFTPLVLALSAIQAASLAEELSVGATHFEAIYSSLALVLAINAVLFLGPLLLFARKLWECRAKGLSDYTVFANRYVSGFDTKWLGAGSAAGEPLLGTPDVQSLADLSNSFQVVRNMRVVPVSVRMLAIVGVAALLPMLPVALFKYPITELIEKFFTRLAGL